MPTFTLRLPDDEHELFAAMAEWFKITKGQSGTMSDLARRYISEGLARDAAAIGDVQAAIAAHAIRRTEELTKIGDILESVKAQAATEGTSQ